MPSPLDRAGTSGQLGRWRLGPTRRSKWRRGAEGKYSSSREGQPSDDEFSANHIRISSQPSAISFQQEHPGVVGYCQEADA